LRVVKCRADWDWMIRLNEMKFVGCWSTLNPNIP
jgi:hypothetical protein